MPVANMDFMSDERTFKLVALHLYSSVVFVDSFMYRNPLLRQAPNVTSNVRRLINQLIKLTMERQIIFLVSAFGLFLIQACDPAKILVVRTANKPNYSVTIYANENILPHFYPYHQDSIAKKVVIHVPTTDTVGEREKTFFFGLGSWGDNSLMPNFSKKIDSIIIVNNNGKLILDKQTEINDYLLKHRHGFAKRILTIEAK